MAIAQDAAVPASLPRAVVQKEPTADRLVHARALAARGEREESHKVYDSVLKAEPRNENALRGKAVLHVEDQEWTKAATVLEKVVAIRPKDRPATLNLAAAYLKQEPANPMRAAKLVMDYLSSASGPPDEVMANALGTALSKADDQARKAFFYPQCREFYRNYDRKLEAKRTDVKKRWGAEWIAAGLADEKWLRLKTKSEAADSAYREWAERSVETRKSKEALALLEISLELMPPARLRAARQRVANAQRAEAQATKKLNTARTELAKTETPPMMDTIHVAKME